VPVPHKGEAEKEYVSRCISVRQHEHPGEPVKQSAAICHSMYRQHKKKKREKE